MTFSPFEQQIIGFVIKGAVFSSLLFIAGLFLAKRFSARGMSLFWKTGLIGLIALPAIGFFFPLIPVLSEANVRPVSIEVSSEPWTVSDTVPVPDSPALTMTPDNPTPSAIPLPWLGIVWITGAGAVFFRWILSSIFVRRVKRDSRLPTGNHFESLKHKLRRNDGRRVQILLNKQLSIPLVAGLFRPVILLPADAEDWKSSTLEKVIAHEMSHVNRRDGLFLLLGQLATAIHWINPLVWMIARRSKITDECCADDTALEAAGDPAAYAELLLSFSSKPRRSHVALSAPTMAHRSNVELRVTRVLNSQQNRGQIHPLAGLSAVLTILLVAMTLGLLTTQRADAENPDLTKAPQTQKSKLESLILPQLELDKASLVQAVLHLSRESKRIDPEKSGVRLELQSPSTMKEPKISLQQRNISLLDAVKEVANQAEVKIEIKDSGVLFVNGSRSNQDSGQMITTIYQIPFRFTDDLQIPGRDPFAPPPGIMELLKNAGVRFGEGSRAILEQDEQKLIVKNTVEEHRKVKEIVRKQVVANAPKVIRLRLELYEMSKADALRFISESDSADSSDKVVENVRELMENGQANLLAVPSLITSSGRRARLESGHPIHWTSGYYERNGIDVARRESIFKGTAIECDPVLGNDGKTIDINLSIAASRGDEKITEKTVITPVSGEEKVVEEVSLVVQQLTTSLTVADGQTQLIGNLQSETADSPKAVLAFLTASVTKALPDSKD